MGELVFAAKVTHVPSMFISEMAGPMHGCRKPAISGLEEIGRRIRALGADTVVILDTHWLVNCGYHVNACGALEGVFTSNEFPHFIKNLKYAYCGNPQLGDAIATNATRKGVRTRSHHIDTLDVEYGTLVPLHFMRMPASLRVVSVASLGFGLLMGLAALNKWHLGPALASGDARVGVAFRRSVAAEYLLIATVLSITAVLTSFYSPD